MQLLTFCVGRLTQGEVSPTVEGSLVSEGGGCLVYDGQHGLGQVIPGNCCKHAIRLATAHGISIVVTRDSTHFGAAAQWAQRISSAGLIGIVMCNASPVVPPWQGREGRLGTNPI